MDIFLNESKFLGISFPAKIIQYTESSEYSLLQSSNSRLFLNSAHLLFWVLVFPDNNKIIERIKLFFSWF